MLLIGADGYRAMPWANGRGTTLEIARSPLQGDWNWRLSLATVDANGPFSNLPGVDRALVVASGRGMDLVIDGVTKAVRPHASIQFTGESAVHCSMIDGPVADLNLMARRAWSAAFGRPRLEVIVVERGQPITLTGCLPLTAVTVLNGSITMTANHGLVPSTTLAHDRDTVMVDPAEQVTISSPRGAVIAMARLEPGAEDQHQPPD